MNEIGIAIITVNWVSLQNHGPLRSVRVPKLEEMEIWLLRNSLHIMDTMDITNGVLQIMDMVMDIGITGEIDKITVTITNREYFQLIIPHRIIMDIMDIMHHDLDWIIRLIPTVPDVHNVLIDHDENIRIVPTNDVVPRSPITYKIICRIQYTSHQSCTLPAESIDAEYRKRPTFMSNMEGISIRDRPTLHQWHRHLLQVVMGRMEDDYPPECLV